MTYSLKNIPLPTQEQYKMELLNKIEIFIKRLRWKAFYFDGNADGDLSKENYGLKTPNSPPPIKDLMDFESDLFNLVNRINFRAVRCDFQNRIKKDISEIKKSKEVLVSADKTANIYKVQPHEYRRLLNNSVTKLYKKSDENIVKVVSKEGKTIAEKFEVAERMNINGSNECFITFKDHKDNFLNNPSTRLINPSKNEIGRISKRVLEIVNSKLRLSTGVKQWQNTKQVIDWFNGLEHKSSGKFMIFDVKDFYPSITESLMELSLRFASEFINIEDRELQAIRHARKWLLFKDGEPWRKRENENFDVTMGAYDGAELCELVGIYLLNVLSKEFNKDCIGLYRDDGLAYFKNVTGRQGDLIRKKFHEIFKRYGLHQEIQCNLKIVNYLDVTFNLCDGSYKPYRKQDHETLYINSKSNTLLVSLNNCQN